MPIVFDRIDMNVHSNWKVPVLTIDLQPSTDVDKLSQDYFQIFEVFGIMIPRALVNSKFTFYVLMLSKMISDDPAIRVLTNLQNAAVKLMRTRIGFLAPPESMYSTIDATQREQRHGSA